MPQWGCSHRAILVPDLSPRAIRAPHNGAGAVALKPWRHATRSVRCGGRNGRKDGPREAVHHSCPAGWSSLGAHATGWWLQLLVWARRPRVRQRATTSSSCGHCGHCGVSACGVAGGACQAKTQGARRHQPLMSKPCSAPSKSHLSHRLSRLLHRTSGQTLSARSTRPISIFHRVLLFDSSFPFLSALHTIAALLRHCDRRALASSPL